MRMKGDKDIKRVFGNCEVLINKNNEHSDYTYMIQVLSFIYIHLFNYHKILEVDSNILLVLQVMKFRHRNVIQLSHHHTAGI